MTIIRGTYVCWSILNTHIHAYINVACTHTHNTKEYQFCTTVMSIHVRTSTQSPAFLTALTNPTSFDGLSDTIKS